MTLIFIATYTLKYEGTLRYEGALTRIAIQLFIYIIKSSFNMH